MLQVFLKVHVLWFNVCIFYSVFVLYNLFTDLVNHSLYHFTIIHKNIDFIGIKSRKPVLNPYCHGDDNRIDAIKFILH